MGRARVGGTRLVGRRYFLGGREVEVLIGWGPGATARNVLISFLDTGERTVRPFRGLTIAPRATPASGQHLGGEQLGRAQPGLGGR
jgi:hypothetical protein